ncbi:MAG: hypothetical protein M1826_002445 [Phylliscum demangeonii]|nr:MAG: hypothetical protein M1826_002445 [Phylliscum demangeonii]
MADDHRHRHPRSQNGRKRRFREEDEHDRRPQRRRYEEPIAVRVRKQLLSLAESSAPRAEDEVASVAKTVADNFFDDEVQNEFHDLLLQLILDQPCKIPFLSAIVLVANGQKAEVTTEVLRRVGAAAQKSVAAGAWREVKLWMRFLALLQGLFRDEGVFPLLEELFARAVDLQTALSEDALGLELVKIILLTMAYVLASSATDQDGLVLAMLDKTDVIASEPHSLEAVVDPFPADGARPMRESPSVIGLLQKQLADAVAAPWQLAFIPRPWKQAAAVAADGTESLASAAKHAFPTIRVPAVVKAPSQAMFPELFTSVYADQDVESVPATNHVASCVMRDVLIDTINVLDFNRHAAARLLTDMDCFFAPATFVARATPFDQLIIKAGSAASTSTSGPASTSAATWKPEDVMIDAVFSQLLQLPAPEHKLVYYHSLLTEACKIAPAAVAPSLGRAIRFLYRHLAAGLDLELAHRFLDWFAHHLSNFGFTWKWTEWAEDVTLPDTHPRKAFLLAALDKEIRLSFAQRIRGTLPEPYQVLIPPAKEKETPDFKYQREDAPCRDAALAIMNGLRRKAPEHELQPFIDAIIHAAYAAGPAADHSTAALRASADAYVTAVCFVGAKSLSHLLSCVERCKERLQAIGRGEGGGAATGSATGSGSAAARAGQRQIISSVMAYWAPHPGVGVNVVDKLLNYSIVTPLSVVRWVLYENDDGDGDDDDDDGAGRGHGSAFFPLAQSHLYELVALTVHKVVRRVKQLAEAAATATAAAAGSNAAALEEERLLLQETFAVERERMDELFAVVEDGLRRIGEGEGGGKGEGEGGDAVGDGDGAGDGDGEGSKKDWVRRWSTVFRRKKDVAAMEVVLAMAMAVVEEVVEAEEAVEVVVEVVDGQGKGGAEHAPPPPTTAAADPAMTTTSTTTTAATATATAQEHYGPDDDEEAAAEVEPVVVTAGGGGGGTARARARDGEI